MSFVGRNNGKISNQSSGGGNKLQGIPSTTDKRTSSIRAIKERAWGQNRNLIFCINQLGGVGRNKSQFNSNADGLNCKEDQTISANNKTLDSLRELQLFINKLNYYFKTSTNSNIKYKLCLIGSNDSFYNDIKKCPHWDSLLSDNNSETPLNTLSDDTNNNLQNIENNNVSNPQATQISPMKSTPSNLKKYYNIPDRNPDIPIKIGIYEIQAYIIKDDLIKYFNNFYMESSLTYENFLKFLDNNVSFIGPDSTNALTTWDSGNNAGGEASLDIQVICGICELGLHPDDEIFIYCDGIDPVAGGNLFTYLNNNKTNYNIPRIWSISYGSFENINKTSSNVDLINKLSKDHYQIFVSSGDTGSSNYRGNYQGPIRAAQPAAYPYITAVGGTVVEADMQNEMPSSYPSVSDKQVAIITGGGGMDGVSMNMNFESNVSPAFVLDNDKMLNKQHQAVNTYIMDLHTSLSNNISPNLITKIINYNINNSFYPRAYPNVALQSTNYPVYWNGKLYPIAGTSAACPLMASIYAIISNKLSVSNYGSLNEYLFDAYYDAIASGQWQVFNPIISKNSIMDNNGGLDDNYKSEVVPYSWNVAKTRLSTASSTDSDFEIPKGYGFDCVVGLGSINAEETNELYK